MNPFNDKSSDNIISYKKILSTKKRLNKGKTHSFELTKGSNDSITFKEKPNIGEHSFKKIKRIKDIMPNTNKNINHKDSLSYQNSNFPICISFMTNTKNFIPSINNKFRVGNPLNISESQTLADFNTIYHKSIINNYNTHKNKKINFKLNFQSMQEAKNQNSIIDASDKKDNSRNIKKFNFYESSDNHSLNNKYFNIFMESTDKSINIYSPKKIMKKELKNQKNIQKESEKGNEKGNENNGQKKERTIEINKFISMNLSKKQLQEMLHEKLKISIDTSEPPLDQKDLLANFSSKNIISKNIKKKNKSSFSRNSNSQNSKMKMPKIVSFYNPNVDFSFLSSEKLQKIEKINNEKKDVEDIKSSHRDNKSSNRESKSSHRDNKHNDKKSKRGKKKEKKDNSKNNDIIIIKKGENEKKGKKEKEKRIEVVAIEKKQEKAKKHKILKKSMFSIIKNKSVKETKKKKYKVNNIIHNNYKTNTINDINSFFLDDIKKINDNYKKDKKINEKIKNYKITMLSNFQTNNMDKIISRQKERLKTFIFSFDQRLNLKDIFYDKIYKNNKNINRKIYLELKKISIRFILFNSYLTMIKKCSLDNNLSNYVKSNVEFSSIYLPEVNIGEEKSLFITDKLFSFKNKKPNNVIQMTKTKFIESKKYKKSTRIIALNFITKELIYFNLIYEKIKIFDFKEKQAPKHRKSLSCKKTKRPADFFNKNSIKRPPSSTLSILQRKDIFDISKKVMKNKLRYSINENLLLYKLSKNSRNNFGSNNNLRVKEKVNRQYLNKAMSLIHENKYKKYLISSQNDFYEILSKIKGRENIEVILRTFILEGETLLFTEYFNNNYRRININSQDEQGNTFLILSVRQGLDNITKFLLEKGVDVDIQNKLGNTALHYALSAKNYIIADLLKKFGAKEDCYNIFGNSPWDIVGRSIEGID